MTAGLSVRQVADRAGVDEAYVRGLIELGALEPPDHGYRERDVHLVALLHVWDAAGLSAESVLEAVKKGDLSLEFLETPAWELPGHLDRTYKELATDSGVPLQLILDLHEAIGFAKPDPDERIRPDDPDMAELARMLIEEGGASEAAVRRIFRVYGDNLRRVATAVSDVYRGDIVKGLLESGMDEAELMAHGTRLGRRMASLRDRALLAILDRHNQHVWTEYSIERAELILERAGLYRRIERPPAISFVDLTGYTRLTEEVGDEEAARLAGNLAMLVEKVSLDHGGRAVRWLGDGGMLLFSEPKAAALAALDMVERAPAQGLPPTHIGIQSGPVIFQDGDVYGRTVNIAARLAARAEAGEVLTSEETAERAASEEVRFERLGPAELKGIARPVVVYRASRAR